jgi:hypothetical protein
LASAPETGSKLLAGSGFYFFIWFLCALVFVFLEGDVGVVLVRCRPGCCVVVGVFLIVVSLSVSRFFMFLLAWLLIFFLFFSVLWIRIRIRNFLARSNLGSEKTPLPQRPDQTFLIPKFDFLQLFICKKWYQFFFD